MRCICVSRSSLIRVNLYNACMHQFNAPSCRLDSPVVHQRNDVAAPLHIIYHMCGFVVSSSSADYYEHHPLKPLSLLFLSPFLPYHRELYRHLYRPCCPRGLCIRLAVLVVGPSLNQWSRLAFVGIWSAGDIRALILKTKSLNWTYIVSFNVNFRQPCEFVSLLSKVSVWAHYMKTHSNISDRVFHTGLVCTTSFKVKFIHVSHDTKCPFKVSPSLSSTNIGWPCAAVRRPKGSCRRRSQHRIWFAQLLQVAGAVKILLGAHTTILKMNRLCCLFCAQLRVDLIFKE